MKHRETEAGPFPSETPILETRGVKQHDKYASSPYETQVVHGGVDSCLRSVFFLRRLCGGALTWLQCWVSGPPLEGKGRNVVGRTAASVRQQAAFV